MSEFRGKNKSRGMVGGFGQQREGLLFCSFPFNAFSYCLISTIHRATLITKTYPPATAFRQMLSSQRNEGLFGMVYVLSWTAKLLCTTLSSNGYSCFQLSPNKSRCLLSFNSYGLIITWSLPITVASAHKAVVANQTQESVPDTLLKGSFGLTSKTL